MKLWVQMLRDLTLEDKVNTENGQIGEVQYTLTLAFEKVFSNNDNFVFAWYCF